jgi:hypothetical protein
MTTITGPPTSTPGRSGTGRSTSSTCGRDSSSDTTDRYLVDDDAEVGFGVDLDGTNEREGSGGENADNKKEVKFVVLCQHDHKGLADDVYIEDDGPPTLATFDNQPGYERFVQ